MRYIEVILPLPLPGYFSYGIQDPLVHDQLVGCRVIVPFGKRKIYTGIVARVVENEPGYLSIKEVIDVLDERPILNKEQLGFIEWISKYYMCSIGEVFNASIPANLKLTSESFVGIMPMLEYETSELSHHEVDILEFLETGERTQEEIRQITGLKSVYRILKSLREKGLIYLFEKVKDKYSPKTEKRVRLVEKYVNESDLQSLSESLESKPKQMDVLLSYLKHVDVFQNKEDNLLGIEKKKLLAEDVSNSSLSTLTKNGVFEVWDQIIDRFAFEADPNVQIPELTDSQQIVYHQILDNFETKHAVLFQGITVQARQKSTYD